MKRKLYGVMGRFETPDDLLEAIRVLREHDRNVQLEAYTPYAVEGLSEALALKPTRIPLLTLIGGVVGGVGGFVMQWYASVISFPQNIGGRPLNSWPMYIPVTFEMVILCAALAAVLGMLFANGLPRLHHPVFSASNFGLATRDRYFLCVRPAPKKADVFDAAHYLSALSRLDALACDEVWS